VKVCELGLGPRGLRPRGLRLESCGLGLALGLDGLNYITAIPLNAINIYQCIAHYFMTRHYLMLHGSLELLKIRWFCLPPKVLKISEPL